MKKLWQVECRVAGRQVHNIFGYCHNKSHFILLEIALKSSDPVMFLHLMLLQTRIIFLPLSSSTHQSYSWVCPSCTHRSHNWTRCTWTGVQEGLIQLCLQSSVGGIFSGISRPNKPWKANSWIKLWGSVEPHWSHWRFACSRTSEFDWNVSLHEQACL